MKGTDIFKRTIHTYLVQQAASDELFAKKYANPAKTIDDCITYILNTVQKSGCNGFCDEEIFGMAIHFYQEDNIEIGNPVNCQVSVNHVVELTAEEKEQDKTDSTKYRYFRPRYFFFLYPLGSQTGKPHKDYSK